ncbi:PotD/PotF family extracellular solute-binding protein [Roseomonas sp. KE0001]|uniref:ABC transporter substrate-binding protein n=1 Tax=unclassified Roseomonas TaxID=2617492 RepID=UPI0018E00C29|nr:extracellular solute-binding protein [Roseomonas sp. KE0001]
MDDTAPPAASRRSVLLGAPGLAAPLFFVRNAWAAGKTVQLGTYRGVQGEYVRKQIVPKFQRDFDCRVLQTENVTLGNIAILRTQKASPAYSVMMMDDVGIPIAKAEGLIEKLPADRIPNLAKVFPNFLYNDSHGAAFAISSVAPWFNAQMAHPPASFADLWHERYRGRYMMITPKQTQSVQLLVMAASLATGKPVLEAQYELEKGWDKMAELRPNVQTIYEIVGAVALQIQQGQGDIAGPDFSKSVLPYVARRAPLRLMEPAEGSFAGVNCLTLVKDAPEPDLGAALIDRILSPEAQKGLAEATYAAPAVTGIELNRDVAAVAPYPESRMRDLKLYVLDWDHINPQRSAIVDRFNQIFGG